MLGETINVPSHFVFHGGFVLSRAYCFSWSLRCAARGARRARRPMASRDEEPFIRRKGRRSGAIVRTREPKNIMPRRATPEPFALQVGTRIRALRHEKGLSLAALADASALSK